MSRVFFLIFIFSFFTHGAQVNDARQRHIDSLTLQFKKDSARIYGFKKIRPFLNYHERNSIENPKIINFFGPQLGVLLHERHFTGVGIYFSSPNTKKPFKAIDQNMPAIKRINITYMTAFYQYILLQYRYLEFHIPLEVGSGIIKARYSTPDDHFYKATRSNFLIGAAGAQLILKPLKWAGFSFIYGYRIAQVQVISGYFYAVGIWIGFKPLIMDVKYLMRKKKYRKEVQSVLNKPATL
jgi:hypothetical protein